MHFKKKEENSESCAFVPDHSLRANVYDLIHSLHGLLFYAVIKLA